MQCLVDFIIFAIYAWYLLAILAIGLSIGLVIYILYHLSKTRKELETK